MKTLTISLGVLVVCLVAPNLLWLARSTLRITNAGTVRLGSVTVRVDGIDTYVGDIPPGHRRLLVLSPSGEATVTVRFRRGAQTETVCNDYVEGSMYHVDVRVRDTLGTSCAVSLPLTSALLIVQLFDLSC